MSATAPNLAAEIWTSLGGDGGALSALEVTGPPRVLPSVYDVTRLASAAVGVACLAAADLYSLRTGTSLPSVAVNTVHAAAAFLGERLLSSLGWSLPPLWDPIAGDYRAADGWIRLHTNYEHHRRAALQALGVPADRSAVVQAVARWEAEALQEAVVEAGGCAAAMHDGAGWREHAHGRFATQEPAVTMLPAGSTPLDDALGGRLARDAAPLAGIRVLDLTRVIAGPVATSFLAGHGAEVLRIDPPGFREVPALVPEVTAGKRCAALDLRRDPDRRAFAALLADAHVLVHGLRPGALTGLGYDSETLTRVNPSLIVATHDAYGWAGPWSGRRGFDSLVQMSCGIAAKGGRQSGTDRPVPLPAQALDYATGYLLAAGVCRGLARKLRDDATSQVRASLVGVANLLTSLPGPSLEIDAPHWPPEVFEVAATAWGNVRRVRCPTAVSGVRTRSIPAGPLGRHAARWEPREKLSR